MPTTTLPTRISDKINFTDSCWLWKASKTGSGYGKVWYAGRLQQAHRVVYELLNGEIPAGLDLDHVKARGCTSRLCVWPEHLEPVTRRVNLLRGDTLARKHQEVVSCPQGHAYDEENTAMKNGTRQCRKCARARNKRWREAS